MGHARGAGRPDDADDTGVWCVEDGKPYRRQPGDVYDADGVEQLTYNNPYSLEIERVWFDGKIVFAVESGEIELEFDADRNAVDNTVAQEYQVVYAAELDERGKLKDGREPERIDGQYNIYDSVPGMEKYSPLRRSSLLHEACDVRAGAVVSSRLGANV